MFNIIARRTLLKYCMMYPTAANALREWYSEIETADFNTFNELKVQYPNASIVGDDRMVFNIMGNRFRLIVRIMFKYKGIQIKWFGTHSEYDRIDAKTISFK
ncbi:MAG: addiction module toxin RelE [Dyadobacter sp. 50-39]|uniref:type II toxin-antitoxin system HigB family toxin n=1 Tax=Dyadobacter sp. 50-39 TaxID=1895756 RepID=UPI00095E907A|nr:type II toxin-antitoxin system HigB family toxin [Dyadobacter sp. 50-39]OJV14637.1 MAG: addiction module toxin RelE [Dyadobacter sp. 50-39]